MNKLLLADDSELFYKFLRDVLKKEGIEIIWAKNKKEAIEKFKEEKPDIVLVDIILSDSNGIDVIKEIKALDKDANIMVISGLDKQDVIKEALDAGARDYIVKNVSPKYFREEILKALKT
ncbi:response regulator [Candidatus Aciduliprofundum boonei]|uniref:Response regulator receiver protein n=1 Tax=Aciduliprofundum boonei (strain DSM 19572 / T469) TaxID=439481 RepID=B5IFR9_ACIB4|nr:response regulator [Candidatus Aciduliprofundum boonei]ADD09002.1 response regulator receiver protein [Aciduliprofundum boonei T469]EDY34878.1 hypothetical protein ABOONEI_1144 [Aciduliprofundum boonei T469]